MLAASALALLLASPPPVAEAERLAAEAMRLAPQQPDQALAAARRGLAATAEFEPTDFVRAGRKGEVVEDEFRAARASYRAHRARLYEAMGVALASAGRPLPAQRYLRRALVLEPSPERLSALVRALLAAGRGGEALAFLEASAPPGGPGREMIPLFEQATDAAGLPSAQAEIDRARLASLGKAVELRDGPLKLPQGTRLSTGAPLKLDASPAVFYVASRICRTCTEDLEAIKELAPGARVLIVPEIPDEDRAIRQVLQLYRYDWPVALGAGMAEVLGAPAGSAVVVGRGGYVIATVKPPFAPALATTLAALGRTDVQESVPRKAWNLRPPARAALSAAPALLPEGLAPGEDMPAPAEFDRAVAAFRGGSAAEARRLIDEVGARDDGWLLPPEARFDRALALARLGRADEARRILLRIGDSRFQDAVDRALEKVASGRR